MAIPLTVTYHAIEQFQQHVAPLAPEAIEPIVREVHRNRILLAAMDPKYPDTPFYWGSHAGVDFAIAVGPDRNNPGAEYAATTIGLGHLERLLRTRRATGLSVEVSAGEEAGVATAARTSGAMGSRPFANLVAEARVAALEWPETRSRSLKYTEPPYRGLETAWAQVWHWAAQLSGVPPTALEYAPLAEPSGWYATFTVRGRACVCFLGQNAMVELYLIDQPARIVPFPAATDPGRTRVVPLTAGVASIIGLPEGALLSPVAKGSENGVKRVQVRALYPGTFDPITKGHLHLISRIGQLFESVVIAAAENPAKGTTFTLEERLAYIRQEVDRAGLKGIEVMSYRGLTVDLALEQGCQVLVRGLRAVSDYEYEVQMATVNKMIAPQVDTLFLMADKDFSFISSSIIKDIL
ncbi:MAG TPA: pantetheine-phosphate adenylyltransferase, partial [bacterium]|nr:pantetheine-phosphate adenylyltransferase [bacterium]